MVNICNEFASTGRNLGNKLFTYSLGVILSEIHDINLYIPNNSYVQRNKINELFPFENIINKRDIKEPLFYVCDSNLNTMGMDELIKNSKDKNIFLDGYFLKYEYVKQHKKRIKKTYSPLISEKRLSDDILIMLRDSNVDPTFAIPNSFYLELLEKENFDNVVVSYDHYEKHIKLIEILQKNYNVILLDLNIIDLFKEITSYNKIIAAQGTFSFWASFLSNAEKIYWPITKMGPNNLTDINVNLFIDDEDRYEHIYI
jgi:hypothetical protein